MEAAMGFLGMGKGEEKGWSRRRRRAPLGVWSVLAAAVMAWCTTAVCAVTTTTTKTTIVVSASSSRQPATFTVRLPPRLPANGICLAGGGRSPLFRLGPRSPAEVTKLAWRWKDMRTGQEIGGEARDILIPPSSGGPGGDGKKEGGGIFGSLGRAVRKRAVKVISIVAVLSGGGMASKVRLRPQPEPFIRAAVHRDLAEKAQRKIVPVAPLPPAPEAPIAPPAAGTTEEQKGEEGAVASSEEAQEPEAHSPVEDAEVAPQSKERKRWTPFRDMRKRASSSSGSSSIKKKEEGGDKEKKGGVVKEGEEEGVTSAAGEETKKDALEEDEKAAEAVEDAKILGEKEATALSDVEQATAQAESGSSGELEALSGEEREGARAEQEKQDDEESPLDEEEDDEEEEEQQQQQRGGGGLGGGDVFKGQWVDRRGTVLLGSQRFEEAPPPSQASEEGQDSGDGATVSIPDNNRKDRNSHQGDSSGDSSIVAPGGKKHEHNFVSSVFRSVGPAVPRVDCIKVYKGEIKFASGSGVIFTPEGHLITNSLLVRNALELKVTLADGREYPAVVKGMDEVLDVAVLKILSNSPIGPPTQQQAVQQSSKPTTTAPPTPTTFEYAPIGNSDDLQVGDWVLSMGSPKSPGPSVILGIVSGLTRTAAEVGRPETQVNFIQTDASFDANVVGGPLVNEYGEVVGINSIGMTTSSTVQFSVPINQIKSVVTDLANGKAVVHPSIGVEMMPITPSLAAQLNNQAMGGSQIHYIPEGGAVVVVNVLEDSPAMEGGLRMLDILLEIEQRPIYKVEDAQRIIQSAGVGQNLEIKVLRQSQEVTLRVKTADFIQLFRKAQVSKLHADPMMGGRSRKGIPRDEGLDRRGGGGGNGQQQQQPPASEQQDQSSSNQQKSSINNNNNKKKNDKQNQKEKKKDSQQEDLAAGGVPEDMQGYLYV